jgi:hypothetical protein
MLTVGHKAKTLKVLKLLAQHPEAYISGNPPPALEQRVGDEGQRVLADTGQEQCPEIQRVSNAPPTMLANNPTSKWLLQAKSCTHQRTTWRNTPGTISKITRPEIAPPTRANTQTQSKAPRVISDMPLEATMLTVPHYLARKTNTVTTSIKPRRSTRLTAGNPHIRFCYSRVISQEAINMLLMDNLQNNTEPFTPTKLALPPTPLMNFKHYAMPMVHPTTGETIPGYKQLTRNNPVSANT